MNDFKIDQYNITVTYDDNKIEDEGGIKPKLYPDLNEANETECTIVLEPKPVLVEEKDFRKWLIESLNDQRQLNSTKIALIEEIGEVRCVTYEELVDGSKRTANYMSHHGVKNGDKILMCMENSVEYVFYQIGAFLLGAIPVLVNQSQVASEKLEDIGCTSVVVDFENYGHVLRVSQSNLFNIERVFVLADDIAAISIPRHVWIIDGLGFLSFLPEIKRVEYSNNEYAVIFPGRQKPSQYIVHTQSSTYYLCNGYFDKLQSFLDGPSDGTNKNHLITNGLHCHDAFSYLYHIIAKGETCVLTESTLDVWRASFLDRIAGIIDQYHVAILIANSQLLKCFIKYEVHKIYDLKSLKIITNHGSVFTASTAQKIQKMLNVILIQAYSGTEFGVVSYGIVDAAKKHLADCGIPCDNVKIKIAHLETGKEVENGEWGEILLSGDQLCSSENLNDKFLKSWFKTGDYGMIDDNNRLHFEGPIEDLIRAQGKQVSSELVESIICQHKMVDDAVIMANENEIWCGVLLKNEDEHPTSTKLEKILKKYGIILTVNKIFVLDFIPRSENGKIMRKEIPYLLSSQEEDTPVDENTESYI